MSTRIPQPQDDQLLRFLNRSFTQFSLQNNVYCVPVDQVEQQRVEDLEGILHELFSGKTVFPPFPPPKGDNESESHPTVLDCGFGQGAWIQHFLDEFGGDCDVTGVDLYLGRGDDDDESDGENSNNNNNGGGAAVQEYIKKRWNLNGRFRDDTSDDQLKPETFDLINSRLLAEGINADRWPSYVKELRQVLKRGGWLQMVEMQLHFQSSTGRLSDDSNLNRWWQWYTHTMQQMNKNARIGRELGQLMAAEGFENVRVLSFDLPIGEWNAGQATLGRDNLEAVDQMLTSLSIWPFLRVGRMPAETYRALIAGAKAELRDSKYKLYYKVYVAFGQRPTRRR